MRAERPVDRRLAAERRLDQRSSRKITWTARNYEGGGFRSGGMMIVAVHPLLVLTALAPGGYSRVQLSRRNAMLAGYGCAFVPFAARSALDTPEVRGLDKEEVVKGFQTLESGVRYAELKAGKGEGELRTGSTGLMQWVLRRSDGYFVDSSSQHAFEPVRIRVGQGELGKALDEALVGMRPGGVRRVLVPVKLAAAPKQLAEKLGLEFGPSRQLERQLQRGAADPYAVLVFELQLDKVVPPSSDDGN